MQTHEHENNPRAYYIRNTNITQNMITESSSGKHCEDWGGMAPALELGSTPGHGTGTLFSL